MRYMGIVLVALVMLCSVSACSKSDEATPSTTSSDNGSDTATSDINSDDSTDINSDDSTASEDVTTNDTADGDGTTAGSTDSEDVAIDNTGDGTTEGSTDSEDVAIDNTGDGTTEGSTDSEDVAIKDTVDEDTSADSGDDGDLGSTDTEGTGSDGSADTTPPRREGLFPSYRLANAKGDRASTKFTNYVHPHAKHKLGEQTRTTLAPGHSVDSSYSADGVTWYLPANLSFSDSWPKEPRSKLYHLGKQSAHMDSALPTEKGYSLESTDERSRAFKNNNFAGLEKVFRYTDGTNHTLFSPLELTINPEMQKDETALGYGYPRYGKVDHTNIESQLVTITHEIGSTGRHVSLSSNPMGGGAVWDIVYSDTNGKNTGFVNHLDFGRGVQTTLVYLFDEDDIYNTFERAWLATEGGGQMWASVGHFDMATKGTLKNTSQECFDNVFGSPCLKIKNQKNSQETEAIPLEYFPWMHEFTPPPGIRPGHWPSYPVDGKTYTSKVPNGGGKGDTQAAVPYGLNPPYTVKWNASVLVPEPDPKPETPRGLIIYPDDRIGKTVDFSFFSEKARPIIQYTVRVKTSATNIPATVSIPALFLKGSLRHWVEFYDPSPEGNAISQVLSSLEKLGQGRFEARQPSFGGKPNVQSQYMAYILSETNMPSSPAIAFYAVGSEVGGPLQSVAVAFNSKSDPTTGNPKDVMNNPFKSAHMHIQPVATHIEYSSGTIHNGGNLMPGTYEWTTFIIVDELQYIKGHIDWLFKEGITGGSYKYIALPTDGE